MTDTADSETRREDRIPVDLNQPIELSVHIPSGDVTVHATERTDVLIGHDTPSSPGDLSDDESELLIDARKNRIEVRANPRAGTGWAAITGDVDLDVVGQIARAFRRGGHWSSAKTGRARVAVGRPAWSGITIEVPRAITGRIEIHSASGDVRIEGVTSAIALSTMSGDVRVIRTRGDLALRTASGDLVVEGATGHVTAQTASGDVRVTSARNEGFHIQTANGDIFLDAMLTGDGPFRAQTASGDVRLTLRRSPDDGEDAATLAYHTVSGDAHVTQPFHKTGRRLWQAGSGDGGPHIDVTTVSGDLVAGFAIADSAFVLASTPLTPTNDVPAPPSAPPAAAIPPAQPPSPTGPAPLTASWPVSELDLAETSGRSDMDQPTGQEGAVRLAVLEAVERGEIDIEEGLRRLEATDYSPTM